MAYVTAALKSFISIFGKKIKIILAVFAAIAALLLVLALLLGLAHLVQYGLSAKNLNRVGEFIWSLKNNPLKIADAYREWYQVLGVSWEKGDFSWGMAIPFCRRSFWGGRFGGRWRNLRFLQSCVFVWKIIWQPKMMFGRWGC